MTCAAVSSDDLGQVGRGYIMPFARCAAVQYALIRDTSSRIRLTAFIGSANPDQGIPTV